MDLTGSCRCSAVRFSCKSHTPVPYMRCYCSICRKVCGGGGFSIHIMGQADSLKVRGRGPGVEAGAGAVPQSCVPVAAL